MSCSLQPRCISSSLPIPSHGKHTGRPSCTPEEQRLPLQATSRNQTDSTPYTCKMPSKSRAIVPVAMDVEMANGGASNSELQAAHADVGNDSGGIVVMEAAEAAQEDDIIAKSSIAVKEGKKKMVARSEIWKHFEKIKVDGVLQKVKCNYCKTQIAAIPLFNGTSTMCKHFHICKCNPQKNIHDDNPVVLQVNHGDQVQHHYNA